MHQCLLLVDIQNDYFAGGAMALDDMARAADNAARILNHFRRLPLPRVHIRHLSVRPGAGFFLPDTAGAEIHSCVAPEAGEAVIQKHYPNSFRETALYDQLKGQDIKNLVICGAMSHMCIDATTRAAFDLGFGCTVVEDACATRALVHKGLTVPAEQVHAAFMAALAVPYARVISTDEFLSAL